MAKRGILALLIVMLSGIGAFVYLSPAPPSDSPFPAARRAAELNSQVAAATRARVFASTPHARLRAAQRKARIARGAAARSRARDKLDGPSKRSDSVRTVIRTIRTGTSTDT